MKKPFNQTFDFHLLNKNELCSELIEMLVPPKHAITIVKLTHDRCLRVEKPAKDWLYHWITFAKTQSTPFWYIHLIENLNKDLL